MKFSIQYNISTLLKEVGIVANLSDLNVSHTFVFHRKWKVLKECLNYIPGAYIPYVQKEVEVDAMSANKFCFSVSLLQSPAPGRKASSSTF